MTGIVIKYQKIQNGIELTLKNGNRIRLQTKSNNIIRVSHAPAGKDYHQQALNKYGFINDTIEPLSASIVENDETIKMTTSTMQVSACKTDGKIVFADKSGKQLTASVADGGIEYKETGYRHALELTKEEEIFGFGDCENRDSLRQRGRKIGMNIKNVSAYIPVPFFMSTKGYGVFINTTWKHLIDVGNANSEELSWEVAGGTPDYYFINGPDFKTIISGYTSITGRPPMLPLFGLGLWFICRQEANEFEVMDNAQKFRHHQIPCDVLGLEPGWMKVYYDLNTSKEWNPERFFVEYGSATWVMRSKMTFIDALTRMGFKLELWEGNDYDVSAEAERRLISDNDDAFCKPGISQNALSEEEKLGAQHALKPENNPESVNVSHNGTESWFEHHKKFIDQGVVFFKQDAYCQTYEHPERAWANGMSDDEIHNLYSLLYCQQMHEGYERYTGKRALCFNPNGWAGFQRYMVTWAGDTGGGPKTLMPTQQLALCGHSYATCDLKSISKEGIHYGFLLPISQINSFAFWLHPWVLGEELMSIFRDYAQLRYRLMPYFYSYAWQAHDTGYPIVRPMLLEFPDDPKSPDLTGQFMLGRELLVGTFSNGVYLPAGRWIDYWSRKEYTGSGFVKCDLPENRGGPLFIRAGSIIPMWPVQDYLGQKKIETVFLNIYPGEDCEFSMYEDDGISLDYKNGTNALTLITCQSNPAGVSITIGKRQGCYIGMPEKRHYELSIHENRVIRSVALNGIKLPETKAMTGTENSWSVDKIAGQLIVKLFDAGKSDSSIKVSFQ